MQNHCGLGEVAREGLESQIFRVGPERSIGLIPLPRDSESRWYSNLDLKDVQGLDQRRSRCGGWGSKQREQRPWGQDTYRGVVRLPCGQ